MPPRIILYTGKGRRGQDLRGRRHRARRARRGPADARHVHRSGPLARPSRSRPRSARPRPRSAPGLSAQQVEAQREMERHWSAVQDWLGELLMERGVDRLSAEELTVPPGLDELFSLLQLKAAHETGAWDVIVVDCAPTGETLRLLSFPDVARWWLEKVFPWERQILAAARPIARSLFDVPVPSEAVFDDVQRLSENLIALNELMRDHERACPSAWS